jgi:hypothetical protein
MHVSNCFFIKYKNNNSIKELVLSLTIGVLAGLTQTYGLIPLVICIFYDFYKNHKIKNVFFLGVCSIIFISLLVLWRQKIPHLDTPNNFNLLKLSNENFNYYANTWTYYLYPLILFIFLRLKMDNIKKLLINEFFLIVIIFCCLAYFYQWQDSRFTFYFWPFLIIYLSVQLQDKNFHKYFAVLSLIFALLSPNSYWSVEVKSLSTNPSNNWAVQFFSASSADRKITQCDLECLKNNEFYQNGDMYIKSVLNTLGKF